MKNFRILTLLTILSSIAFINTQAFSEVYFSGFAGAKTDLTSSSEDSFSPAVNVQSFFSGQFNISEKVIAHTEFSLATDDLIENSILKETPSTFKIDELSLIFRSQFPAFTNYLSAFIGTYEPIGSDIFLRRQFGIQSIASKITESWLGLSGSIIYPMFGIGGSDIIHFKKAPIATGLYIYINHELDDCYVFNSDYRLSGVFRFFTFDFATGIGVPLKSNDTEDAFVVIDKLYWRGGLNLLIGNNYTNSLFIQAGTSDLPLTKQDSIELDEESTYLLFEPRIKTDKCQVHLTVFSLPQDTVDDFIFIDDTFGANFNVFTDDLHLSNKTFTFGMNTALTFPNKTLFDLIDDAKNMFDDYNVTVAPYFATNFYNGEVHLMVQAKIMEFVDKHYGQGIKVNLGYKTQF